MASRASEPGSEGIDFPPYEMVRSTGIRVICDVPWGSHISIFYETTQDLLNASVPFFAAGLQNHEFCLWTAFAPITAGEAVEALRTSVPDLSQRLATGQIEVQLCERDRSESKFCFQRRIGDWHQKLSSALSKGFEGMRVSGNAFGTPYWEEFCEYERCVDQLIVGTKTIALCTYRSHLGDPVQLEMARIHHHSIVRRNREWRLLEIPDLRRAPPSSLTLREREVLAEIVRGLSSREIAHLLSISRRTVGFHRTNLLRKLGAKNTADLVRKGIGQ